MGIAWEAGANGVVASACCWDQAGIGAREWGGNAIGKTTLHVLSSAT